MNISKHIKWTRVVPILPLVLLAICSLTIGEKSRVSLLTSKAASYVTNKKIWEDYRVRSSDLWQVDNYTVRYDLVIPAESDGFYNSVTACGLSASAVGGADLEYYIQLRFQGLVMAESSWKSINDLHYITWNWSDHSYTDDVTIRYYIRKSDHSDLSPSSFYDSSFFAYGFNDVPIDIQVSQTTAIPSDWLDNTTQTYQTVTTVTRPAEYDSLVGTVPVLTPDVGGTPPSWFKQFNPMEQSWFVDIISSLADFTEIVNSVSAQMKIFWVFGGFVITGLLLAWLLH